MSGCALVLDEAELEFVPPRLQQSRPHHKGVAVAREAAKWPHVWRLLPVQAFVGQRKTHPSRLGSALTLEAFVQSDPEDAINSTENRRVDIYFRCPRCRMFLRQNGESLHSLDAPEPILS
jgi:hypothetical protein